MKKFFKILFFTFYKFWVWNILFFFLIEFCKACVIHGLVRNSSFFLFSYLSDAFVSNRLSVLERYQFIEKLISFFLLHKVCFQSVWSSFIQSYLKTLNFAAGSFVKKSLTKKIGSGRWSENVDHVILLDSISSKEVELEVLEILIGKSKSGNIKFELSVSIKLFNESGILYFNKSILKLPNKNIVLEYSFCSFNYNGEIISVIKSFIWSLR